MKLGLCKSVPLSNLFSSPLKCRNGVTSVICKVKRTGAGNFQQALYSSSSSTSGQDTDKHLPFLTPNEDLKPEYDVVIIGGGHNGLVSAAYLQKAGHSVCVLERRHLVGGAAVTEEMVPGFKFSRASYVLSLLRPFIIRDLKLEEFGLKFHMREPYSSFTPISESQWKDFPSKYLLLSSDLNLSCKEISKFSKQDAENYPKYEKQMSQFIQAVNLLLDNRPPNFWQEGEKQKLFSSDKFQSFKSILQVVASLRGCLPDFHEMLTASADKILNKWFESEPLKATLATDALIGNMAGPSTPGTGYVLLHHLMGGVNGKAGAWAYPEGGMGAVSNALAASASQLGASIFINKEVQSITYEDQTKEQSRVARGVVLKSGEEIRARLAVFASTTPEVTFKKFFPASKEIRNELFGSKFVQSIDQIDYTSPVTKINVAVSKLPTFSAKPNSSQGVQDEHKCTIHLNSENMSDLLDAYSSAALKNVPSERPMIEMVIPSSLDETLAPKGAHVCLLFTQFTPIEPSNGRWTDADFKDKYAQRVFDIIEGYSPGFKQSIVGSDILTPRDLEDTFGLTGGNIFHGSMSLDQLYWLRPIFTNSCWFPKTPLKGLYLCGSGCHPGGGVMGVPGYLAAKTLLNTK